MHKHSKAVSVKSEMSELQVHLSLATCWRRVEHNERDRLRTLPRENIYSKDKPKNVLSASTLFLVTRFSTISSSYTRQVLNFIKSQNSCENLWLWQKKFLQNFVKNVILVQSESQKIFDREFFLTFDCSSEAISWPPFILCSLSNPTLSALIVFFKWIGTALIHFDNYQVHSSEYIIFNCEIINIHIITSSKLLVPIFMNKKIINSDVLLKNKNALRGNERNCSLSKISNLRKEGWKSKTGLSKAASRKTNKCCREWARTSGRKFDIFCRQAKFPGSRISSRLYFRLRLWLKLESFFIEY